ncbi:MAG: hypothetical protein NTY29_10505, partial [Proteobacteria bacterium]|nr:hypothetical protein [Pseudomonadota bacterium]
SSVVKKLVALHGSAARVSMFGLSGSCKSSFLPGWSKTSGCKAREIKRNEAYITVRRNDEG